LRCSRSASNAGSGWLMGWSLAAVGRGTTL
jgi:hypothetical protein